ncbi:hypothetical protein [Nocardioides marmoriginsengisoli]|uniref:hypothetical protein n=1 Tax=Nocardioides marmoriginsengisoli TaxID=661483 RepID=UPI0011CE9BC2|nr:hypothetical protein [Nocardioides marmoriginsengisoli]
MVADLTDLIDDQGIEALGDPVAYAAELRQAAGLVSARKQVRERVAVGIRVHAVLDAAKARCRHVLEGLPGDVDELLTSLQPAWWVVRAYIAVQSVLLSSGGWSLSPVPDDSISGALALLVVVAASVQLGRGRLWPLTRWSGSALLRVVVLAINLIAIGLVPAVAGGFENREWDNYDAGYSDGMNEATGAYAVDDAGGTLFASGLPVGNIYPYDAAGNPLVGIQLFDQHGNPIQVKGKNECVYEGPEEVLTDTSRVFFPWSDGAAQRWNVFPLPSRIQGADVAEPDPTAFTGTNRPAVSGFPFVAVPKVSLPGLLTSAATTPPKAFVPGARTEDVNLVESGC